MSRSTRTLLLFFALLLSSPTLLQSQNTQPYLELSASTFEMRSDRALSYTFHRFDPSLFLGSAHEHFNVDAFNSAEERFQQVQLKFYYPLSDLIDLHVRLPWHHKKRNSGSDFFKTKNTGFGEVVLGGSYQWYNSTFKTGKEGFTMRLGLELSLPSGSFEKFSSDGELEPQMQAGKGSISPRIFHLALLNRDQLDTGISLGLGYNQVASDIMNERALFNEFEGGEDTGGQWLHLLIAASLDLKPLTLLFSTEQVLWQSLLGQQFERGYMAKISVRYALR